MFKKLRLDAAAERVIEEKLFEEALAELDRGERRDGLWAKALSESDGNEQKAKAQYLRLRVQAMRDASVIMDSIASASQSNVTDRGRSKAAGEPMLEQEASEIDWKTIRPGHKGTCSVCGAAVTINYGDAYRTLCKNCS
ncbi:hypothetical protein [uncultured Marinobacter sp.]|uniref:hypothetical protein n=1 Tax=uncultured Marinobacter sp. TaxID=187379 RepID=UPI0032B212D5|tara:strand:+ start:2393 stop:2809 length:417 start_codon:yes stop_codon:yes gene_type:complete